MRKLSSLLDLRARQVVLESRVRMVHPGLLVHPVRQEPLALQGPLALLGHLALMVGKVLLVPLVLLALTANPVCRERKERKVIPVHLEPLDHPAPLAPRVKREMLAPLVLMAPLD